MDMAVDVKAKLVLLGDTGVGKSCLIKRFVQNSWSGNEMTTIGASFFTHRLTANNKTYQLDLWDTAGQERYKSFAPIYYRGASAALIVYDITNRRTLQEAKWWLKQLRKTCDISSMAIGFVGNKLDLAEETRQVAPEDVEDFVEENGLIHCETSAKTAANVAELFTRICERVKPLPPDDAGAFSVSDDNAGGRPGAGARGGRRKKCCA